LDIYNSNVSSLLTRIIPFFHYSLPYSLKGRCGRDRMAIRFTITYTTNAYHNWCCEFESRSGRGAQHYV